MRKCKLTLNTQFQLCLSTVDFKKKLCTYLLLSPPNFGLSLKLSCQWKSIFCVINTFDIKGLAGVLRKLKLTLVRKRCKKA